MYNVCFHGGETAGSVAKRNMNSNFSRREIPEQMQTPEGDKICFKGGYYGEEEKKGASLGSILFGTAATAALIIGGLGYVHKADLIGKMKDGKVKDALKHLDKVTETCHKWCSKVKNFISCKK